MSDGLVSGRRRGPGVSLARITAPLAHTQLWGFSQTPRQVSGFAPSLFSPKPHRPPKSHMNLNDGHDDVLGHQVHCSSKGNQLPLVGLHLHPDHITSTAGSYVVRWQASGISLHLSSLRSGPAGLCQAPPHSWLTKYPRWSTQKRRTAAQISKTKKK